MRILVYFSVRFLFCKPIYFCVWFLDILTRIFREKYAFAYFDLFFEQNDQFIIDNFMHIFTKNTHLRILT